jgi:hypothetical protein
MDEIKQLTHLVAKVTAEVLKFSLQQNMRINALRMALEKNGSSEEFMGRFRLGQLAK